MANNIISQYVSPWLIHWTARTGDHAGLENLNAILSTQLLKLSENQIFKLRVSGGVKTLMVCFTDVPLPFSTKHCARYGRFGIAFDKRKLTRKGAQPVFYVTPGCREDVKKILRYILDPSSDSNVPKPILEALQKHFYFIQEFSEGSIDSEDAYYYEREWRLGEQALAPEDLWQLPNPKTEIKKAGFSAHYGKRVVRDGASYFAFDDDDVSFVVCPAAYAPELQNPKGYEIRLFEDIVKEGLEP